MKISRIFIDMASHLINAFDHFLFVVLQGPIWNMVL